MQHTPHPDLLHNLQQEMDDDLHPVLRWIVDHIKALGIAAATLVALVAGWSALEHYQDVQLARTQEALARLAQQPPSTQTVAGLKALAAEHPKIAVAALLEAAVHAGALQDSAEEAGLWQHVATRADSLTAVATLAQVQALMRAQRFAEALALTQQTSWPEGLKPLALSAQAFAAESAGKPAQALAAYQELKTLVSGSPYIDAKITLLQKNPK
ncbi:MAG: hypothetical protein WHT64_00645 [Desulfomicrobiaceae bacterium]